MSKDKKCPCEMSETLYCDWSIDRDLGLYAPNSDFTIFDRKIIIGTYSANDYMGIIKIDIDYCPLCGIRLKGDRMINQEEQSKSLDWKLSNEELILNSLLASYLSETFNYEIKKYSDDSYYYITVYDTSLDIDNNFELVKNLNEQSLTDDLSFIFVVGGGAE